MASLIESIFFGDENYAEQPNAIIVWLSDSPQLNEQSKLKIDSKADKIRLTSALQSAKIPSTKRRLRTVTSIS